MAIPSMRDTRKIMCETQVQKNIVKYPQQSYVRIIFV